MAEVQLSTVVDLDLVKMKWHEQYVSEGLNRKIVPSQPPGIYQGLRIIENTTNPRQVELAPDPDTNFHMAVYQSTVGYSLTYWDRAGTSIILDLSDPNLSSQETIIGLEMDYTIGVDTTAYWMAFPIADWNALPAARKNEIVVLGTVQVPALLSTDIVTADISYERSTYAWRGLSKGVLPWSPVLRNGDFEQGAVGTNNAWYWETAEISGGGTGTVRVTSSDVDRNLHALTFSSVTSGAMTLRATQNVNVPVTPGQMMMVRFRKKTITTSTAGPAVKLEFADGAGTLSSTLSVTIDVSAVDGSYQEVLQILEVPASVSSLRYVRIDAPTTYGSGPATGFHIDDIQVWLETEGQRNDHQHGASGDLEVSGRLGIRGAGDTYSQSSGLLTFDGGTNQLNVDDRAGSGGVTMSVKGDLDVVNDAAIGNNASVVGDVTSIGGDITSIAGDISSIGGSIAALGASLLGSVANAGVARIVAAASTFAGVEYTLMWESRPSPEPGFRLYVSSTGTLVMTINASYDNSTDLWTKDVLGGPYATQFEMTDTALYWRIRQSDADWAQASWTDFVSHVGAFSGVVNEILTLRGNLEPTSSGSYDIGTATTQYKKAWLRALAIGENPSDLPDSHAITIKGNHPNTPVADENESEYVSRYFGIWARSGWRFVEEWDQEVALPTPWDTATITGGTGSTVLSTTITSGAVTISHDGANAGQYIYYTDDSIRWRLTDGVVCRVRMDINPNFTQPEMGFFTSGGTRGITIRPNVVDGGGAHDWRICRGGTLGGAATQTINMFHDTLLGGGQRWWTFMVKNGRVSWVIDDPIPDPEDPTSDLSDSQRGSELITVPTGLWNFGFCCDSGGGGFGSNIVADYVEIIGLDREG